MKKIIAGIGIAAAGVMLVPVFAFAATIPECVSFDASRDTVNAGDRVELSWVTKNGTSLTITPNVYNTGLTSSVVKGHVTVFPKKDTDYTLSVMRGSEKDTCTVSVNVRGSVSTGTVSHDTVPTKNDTVVAYETRDQQPVSTVAITQIPYTGVDMSTTLQALFFTLLALWIASIAYATRTKKSIAHLFTK